MAYAVESPGRLGPRSDFILCAGKAEGGFSGNKGSGFLTIDQIMNGSDFRHLGASTIIHSTPYKDYDTCT